MKYMGSKRAMLQNGLGTLLASEIQEAGRFVDLFTGSGTVAWFVATRHPVKVLAFDLQSYSVAMAAAVISRKQAMDWSPIWDSWHKTAKQLLSAVKPPTYERLSKRNVLAIREWCSSRHSRPITRSYGGHYFSAQQALWIDAFRKGIPKESPGHEIALAALIRAASECAAAPGHTAQPFQPTVPGKPFVEEAWTRDVCVRTKSALSALARLHANQVGKAEVRDANEAAGELRSGDLVFVDPPYSGVHYSRFYHVLETIARGECGDVSGIGRYPSREFRPWSKYSVKSESSGAVDDLLKTIALRKANVILTFPNHDCSNGLSGSIVRGLAAKYFFVKAQSVKSRFSTLGGNGTSEAGSDGRPARHSAEELILVLKPL